MMRRDLSFFEHFRLLLPDVGCQEQQPRAKFLGREVRSAAFQLLDDHPDVLVAEVSLDLDEVTVLYVAGVPADFPIETGRMIGFAEFDVL